MAKKRKIDKKIKKRIRLGLSFILILIVISTGLYYYLKDNELTVLNDTTAPPNHKNFLSFNYYINTETTPTQFVFVSDKSTNLDNFFGANSYEYVRSAGIQYYKGNDYSLLAGKGCERQQLIRFVFCDNAFDKSKCKTDIFQNLWLVNSLNDYPNFKEFYTGDGDGFYYSYSCYEKEEYKAITVADDVEKKYLYDGKCISSKDSNWKKGTNYNTARECLNKLAEQLEEESQQTCSKKEYNEFVCKTNNVYQKERLTDCSIGFTEFVKRCDYGCEGGECKEMPQKVCNYEEFNDFKCIDNIKYQKIQERDCNIGYLLPIESCNEIIPTTPITPTTPETNETIDLTTDLGEGFKDIECRGYQKGTNFNALGYSTECEFCLKNLFSNQGLSDAREDFRTEILISTITIIIIAIILFMPINKIRGKEKWKNLKDCFLY